MLLFVFGSVGRLGRGVCRLLTARANEQSALGLLEETGLLSSGEDFPHDAPRARVNQAGWMPLYLLLA
ncbi:hypothetical protein EYF80_031509 [Liparis tanakae]|uniref:Uncharacterized protein n=1 Tax=Liparis tanakae TaxID=230148 RepID=A0A4Z2GXT8_9TELE|nr:hypothetical protein EYF80_031509 [Liparis tanakae]